MGEVFFDRPILNSLFQYPARHWELDADGQPTQHIVESRRRAEFITPSIHANFTTSKASRWQTDPRKCHVNTAYKGFSCTGVVLPWDNSD
jgi:hypothetical protein